MEKITRMCCTIFFFWFVTGCDDEGNFIDLLLAVNRWRVNDPDSSNLLHRDDNKSAVNYITFSTRIISSRTRQYRTLNCKTVWVETAKLELTIKLSIFFQDKIASAEHVRRKVNKHTESFPGVSTSVFCTDVFGGVQVLTTIWCSCCTDN